jgi:hypothetical protein
MRTLEDRLRAAGAEVWVDHQGIRGGDNLPAEISNALRWCNTLLLIWSSASVDSYWVELEWTNALSLKKRIIPCLIDQTELPPILSHKAYVKMSNVDEGFAELLRALQRHERPKEETPRFSQDNQDHQVIEEPVEADSTKLKGHPLGLTPLCITEFAERFSYYGVRAILILFMTAPLAEGGLGFDQNYAGIVYVRYVTSIYLTALLGGLIAISYWVQSGRF